jgi:ribonuclease P protein component
VRRNLVKRLAREQFRLMHANLKGYDILLRLIAKPGLVDRVTMAAEIRQLLGKLRVRNVPVAESQ